MTSEIAERYAQGLYELALENGTVETKKEQAEILLQAMNENPDVELLFQAVKISKEEKRNFIDQILGKAADHDMVSFLKLVVDKGRSFYMEEMLREFIHLCEEKLGIQHALVESARKLDETEMEKIRSALVKKTGKKIVLENRIDPSLIAGIKVVMENNVTDVTVSSQLERLRRTLLKGGQA
jgi:F-type H+-transporting ATPase subunit delta